LEKGVIRFGPFSVGVFLLSSGTTLLVSALVLAGMATWQPSAFPPNWPFVVVVMTLPGLVFLGSGILLMYWSMSQAPGASAVEHPTERVIREERGVAPEEAAPSVIPTPPAPPPPLEPSVPAEPLHPPSPPPTASEPFWTAWRLSLIAGALILFIGVAYFLRSVVVRWPETGIVLALMTGIAVLTLGHRLIQRGWRAFGFGIDALGLGILYLSLYAAFWRYRFIPQAVAFAGMALTTLTGVGLALQYRSAFLIVMALTGGFLTPLWLSTGPIQEHLLFPYLIVLDLAIPVILAVRRWRVLYGMAYFWTQVYWWAYLLDAYEPDRLTTALGYGTGLFLIFLVAPLLYPWLRPEPLPFLDLMVVLGNGILGFGSGWYLLSERLESAGVLGLLPLGFAGVYAAVAAVTAVRARHDRVLRDFLGSLAVVFLTLVFPVQWDWHWVTVGWAAEAVALTWLGTKTGQRPFRLAAGVVTTLMLTHLLVFDTPLRDGASAPPFWNVRTASYGTAIVALFLQQWLLRRVSTSGGAPGTIHRDPRTWAWFGIYALAFLWLVLETWRSMGLWGLADWRGTALIAIGASFSLVALLAPPTLTPGLWRFIGGTVLGMTVVCLLVLEVPLRPGPPVVLNHRTASFLIVVGALAVLALQARRQAKGSTFQRLGILTYFLSLLWVILETTYALDRAGQPDDVRTACVTALLSWGALPALRLGVTRGWRGMARTGGGLLSLSIIKLFVYDWVGGGTRGFSRAAAFMTVGLATLIAGWWTYRKRG
jgi:hypothetical protein